MADMMVVFGWNKNEKLKKKSNTRIWIFFGIRFLSGDGTLAGSSRLFIAWAGTQEAKTKPRNQI